MNIKVGDYVRGVSTGRVYRVTVIDDREISVAHLLNARINLYNVIPMTDVEVLEAKLKGLIYGE